MLQRTRHTVIGRILRGMSRAPFGLCNACAHQRIVRSGRGSEFSLCERSFDDPRYAKYPRVPVGACPGFTPRSPAATDAPAP